MTSSNDQPDVVVACEPGSGRGTWAMGSLFEHLAGPEETAGSLGVALVTQPPGVATPCTVTTTRRRRSISSTAG
jgi:hypothetical protein